VNASLVVLYDGWHLIYHPNAVESLHLLTLLAHLPQGIEPLLALPAEPPQWLPPVPTCVRPTPQDEFAHLRWEQYTLPHLAHRLGVSLLHLTTLYAPLFSAVKVVVSPGGFEPLSSREAFQQRMGGTTLAGRLRFSLGRGGLTRPRFLLWCDDLPLPSLPMPTLKLPPIVHPLLDQAGEDLLLATAEVDLPETFVLYHGPSSRQDVEHLLEAWSWAAASIGEDFPLLIAGLSREGRQHLHGLLQGSDLAESIHLLPNLSPLALLGLYRRCTALFHPARLSPWDMTIRSALALGKPVVSIEHPWSDAIVGEAAYLIPEADTRNLGAAIITVIVEEEVALRLSQAALRRAASWKGASFGAALWQAYQQILQDA
jgi:glycosyltransferase involved in cell wall biosynthesis